MEQTEQTTRIRPASARIGASVSSTPAPVRAWRASFIRHSRGRLARDPPRRRSAVGAGRHRVDHRHGRCLRRRDASTPSGAPMSSSIFHGHQVPDALGEFSRVLRPDGFALITSPDLETVADRSRQARPRPCRLRVVGRSDHAARHALRPFRLDRARAHEHGPPDRLHLRLARPTSGRGGFPVGPRQARRLRSLGAGADAGSRQGRDPARPRRRRPRPARRSRLPPIAQPGARGLPIRRHRNDPRRDRPPRDD